MYKTFFFLYIAYIILCFIQKRFAIREKLIHYFLNVAILYYAKFAQKILKMYFLLI